MSYQHPNHYGAPAGPMDVTPQWLSALRSRIAANDLEAVTQVQSFLSQVRDIGSVHYLFSALPITPWPPAAIGSANATHAFNLVPGIVYYMLKVVIDSHKNMQHRPTQYFNPRQPVGGGWNAGTPPWFGILAGDPPWLNNQPPVNPSWNPAFSQHEQNQSNQIQQLQHSLGSIAQTLGAVMEILKNAGLIPPTPTNEMPDNGSGQPPPGGSGE